MKPNATTRDQVTLVIKAMCNTPTRWGIMIGFYWYSWQPEDWGTDRTRGSQGKLYAAGNSYNHKNTPALMHKVYIYVILPERSKAMIVVHNVYPTNPNRHKDKHTRMAWITLSVSMSRHLLFWRHTSYCFRIKVSTSWYGKNEDRSMSNTSYISYIDQYHPLLSNYGPDDDQSGSASFLYLQNMILSCNWPTTQDDHHSG